jgi:hypothetical protein
MRWSDQQMRVYLAVRSCCTPIGERHIARKTHSNRQGTGSGSQGSKKGRNDSIR